MDEYTEGTDAAVRKKWWTRRLLPGSHDEPRHAPLAPIPKINPLLQVMPGKMVRIDPSVVPHLIAWLRAYAVQWRRILEAPLPAGQSAEVAADRGRRRWAEHAISAMLMLCHSFMETIPIERIDRAMAEWQAGLICANEGYAAGTPVRPDMPPP